MKIYFGSIVNDKNVLKRILLQSDLCGEILMSAEGAPSASTGLNGLLKDAESKQYDVAVLVHQDVYLPTGWVKFLPDYLSALAEDWIVAGTYGIDERGVHCGRVWDRRVPKPLFTNHTFPQKAKAFDACCLIVKLNKGFYFDETMPGFDLYDTYAALRANELGSAWIIGHPPEHFATRSFDWKPDDIFMRNWDYLKKKFPDQKVYSTVAEEVAHSGIEDLKDKHKGEEAWIVGKGPSLNFLRTEHFGPGPIITMSEAVVPVEALGMPNPVYSMQKGGGGSKCVPEYLLPDCNSRDCDNCHGVIRPKRATLLVHDRESFYCFSDYQPRYIFTLDDIGMSHNEFSLVCAVKMAQVMGCTKFNIVSCDAHVSGDCGTAFPEIVRKSDSYYQGAYGKQKELLKPYLEGLEVKWITPKEN